MQRMRNITMTPGIRATQEVILRHMSFPSQPTTLVPGLLFMYFFYTSEQIDVYFLKRHSFLHEEYHNIYYSLVLFFT